jgi:hypothetical protein
MEKYWIRKGRKPYLLFVIAKGIGKFNGILDNAPFSFVTKKEDFAAFAVSNEPMKAEVRSHFLRAEKWIDQTLHPLTNQLK